MEDKMGEHVGLPAVGNREDVKAEQVRPAPGKEYILPLTSALLLSYGYIYVRAYYGTFGIDVHSFFTIQDYLTENIDNIYTLILPLIFSIFFGFMRGERRGFNLEPQKRYEIIRSIDRFVYSLLLIPTLIGIYYLVRYGKINYISLFMISYIVFYYMEDKIIPELIPKTHELSRPYYIVLCIFLPLSLCNTFITAKVRAQHIIENFINTDTSVIIKSEIEKELRIKADALVLLGANALYFFFYDPSTKSSHVIKVEAISRVTVTEKPWQKQPATPIPYP